MRDVPPSLSLSPFLFLCLSPTELEGGKRLLAIIFGILVTKLYCWIKPYLQLPSLTFSLQIHSIVLLLVPLESASCSSHPQASAC